MYAHVLQLQVACAYASVSVHARMCILCAAIADDDELSASLMRDLMDGSCLKGLKQSGELSVYLGICSNVPLYMQNSQTVGTC